MAKQATTTNGGIKSLTVKFNGITPILMNPMSEEQLLALFDSAQFAAPETKGKKPVEVAAARLYRDEEGYIGIPGLNLFAAIVAAGTFFADPSVKGGKTKLSTNEKSSIPAFLTLSADSTFCRFHEIPEPFDPAKVDLTAKIMKPCAGNPFIVDIRRGVNKATKGANAVIRPRIDKWSFTAKFEFDSSQITEELLRNLMTTAGSRCGVGDFRPNKRGIFGKFQIIDWKVEEMNNEVAVAA